MYACEKHVPMTIQINSQTFDKFPEFDVYFFYIERIYCAEIRAEI